MGLLDEDQYPFADPRGRKLLDDLAELYNPRSAEAFSRQAALPIARIDFRGSAHEVWQNVLDAAAKSGKLRELARVIVDDPMNLKVRPLLQDLLRDGPQDLSREGPRDLSQEEPQTAAPALPAADPPTDAALVTIHGFWSSPATWQRLSDVWSSDPELRGLRIHPFGYPSPKRPRLPFAATRVPDYDDIAQTFATEYETALANAPRIAIVTHSQGGLILQRFLAWMASEGRAHELDRIRSVVMLACPNGGSEYLESLRRTLGFGRHPQAGSLEVLDRKVADTQRYVLRHIVNASATDNYHHCIPFHVYAGASDNIVRAASAQASFPGASTLAGNHFTILDPGAPGNRTAETVKRHILTDVIARPAHSSTVSAPQVTEPGKPYRIGQPADALAGDPNRQIGTEDSSSIDNEFQNAAHNLDRSEVRLDAAPVPASANEPITTEVGSQDGVHQDGSGRKKKLSSKTRKIWAIAGTLTAITVVITVIIVKNIIDSSNYSGNSPYGFYSSSAPPTPPNGWADKRWAGELLVSSGEVDLGSLPPNVNSESGNDDITVNNSALTSFVGPIASWPGKGIPTAKECSDLVITEGVTSLTPKPGQIICIKTTGGDVAILVVQKNYLDETGDITSTLVQATVWSGSAAAPYKPAIWPNEKWTGQLLVSSGEVDLGSVPPNVNSDSGDDITLGNGMLTGLNPIAPWIGKGLPTAAECSELVITEGETSLTPTPGQAICVETAQNEIAVLVVEKNNLNGDGSVVSTLVQATVWSK